MRRKDLLLSLSRPDSDNGQSEPFLPTSEMKSAAIPVGMSLSVVNRLFLTNAAVSLRKSFTSQELRSASSLPKPGGDALRSEVEQCEWVTLLDKLNIDDKPWNKFDNFPGIGLCKASQIVEVFPTVSPEIVIREARVEDCWEVAETHCSSFFPEYSFPLDFVLRIDRLVGMLAGFSVPGGRHRVCLVAVTGCSADDGFLFGNKDIRIGGFDASFSLNKGYVAGILTVDTVADFLPRKGPLRQRRTGIAYVSNVAVRECFRRKGIAKRLMAKAEAQARIWGCRAVALHCDSNNPGATKLYRGQGFKCIKVPEGANWPQPKTSPDIRFNFMMKLL